MVSITPYQINTEPTEKLNVERARSQLLAQLLRQTQSDDGQIKSSASFPNIPMNKNGSKDGFSFGPPGSAPWLGGEGAAFTGPANLAGGTFTAGAPGSAPWLGGGSPVPLTRIYGL